MAAALEHIRSIRTLAELKPRVGEKIQVETRAPRNRFTVQLLGFRENGSLMVSAPKKSISLNEGAVVTLRLISGNYIAAFSAKLLKINSSPFAYWHLEYPDEVEVQRIRSHTRVPVNMLVSVDEYEPGENPHIDWPVKCYCSDISVQGACIDAPIALAKQDKKLFVTARFEVAGLDQVVLLPATLRSVQASESGVTKVVSHGFEFIELDEESRLILTAFVYQQFLIECGELEIIA